MIAAREPLVILSGAGVSAESGVPTFRGFQGLWEQHRPETLATPEAFRNNPALVWRFYRWRRDLVARCRPNPAHTTIAEMQTHFHNFTLLTQNVDGLHQRAGSQDVVELHGSLWNLKCTNCTAHWEDHSSPMTEDPRCPACGSLARPDVIWFGEELDPIRLQTAESAVRQAKTMLIIGTSALVYPAAQLPLLARAAGAKLMEFNLEMTPLSEVVDEFYEGEAGKTLPAWWNEQQE